MKHITLENSLSFPLLGFGTWQMKDEACESAVQKALRVGYRHLDTADRYDNHEAVGKGIQASGVPREEIFLTTKLWKDAYKHDGAIAAVERFLTELDTDYLDLLLLHWPDRSIPFAETFSALEEMKQAGKIKAIGVANCTPHHLQDIIDAGLNVAVNQIELHPTWQQPELVAFCQKHNIAVTAYSPLGRGEALELPVLQELAKKHDATPAQIIIAWFLAKDISAIPKSSNAERIAENFAAGELTLSDEEIQHINNVQQTNRIIHPDFADFDY